MARRHNACTDLRLPFDRDEVLVPDEVESGRRTEVREATRVLEVCEVRDAGRRLAEFDDRAEC